MVAGKRFTFVAALAAATVALGAAGTHAAQIRIAALLAKDAAAPAIAQPVHWKRSHRKSSGKRHAHRKGAYKGAYNKRWAKPRHHAKRWRGASDYGVTYVRPKPYAYIYRYQPYVYHRPRVFIRPIPRTAHRKRHWSRDVWRRRYDRRPGVYYYHR